MMGKSEQGIAVAKQKPIPLVPFAEVQSKQTLDEFVKSEINRVMSDDSNIDEKGAREILLQLASKFDHKDVVDYLIASAQKHQGILELPVGKGAGAEVSGFPLTEQIQEPKKAVSPIVSGTTLVNQSIFAKSPSRPSNKPAHSVEERVSTIGVLCGITAITFTLLLTPVGAPVMASTFLALALVSFMAALFCHGQAEGKRQTEAKTQAKLSPSPAA